MPGSELAEAFVRLRVDSSKIKKDVQKGIAGADGTAAGQKAGSQFGEGFGAKASAEIKKKSGKIAAAGVAAVAVVGVASIKMAADFQSGMARLVTSAGEAQKNLGLVSAGVLKIAVSTGTSTEQLSTGLYTVESAGFHAAAGLTVLKAAAQGARAENASLATVTDAVTTVLVDYHLKATDATKVTSALVATVASGKTNMELLSGSLSRVLPTAAALHVAFPQIASDIAVLTAHGVSARLATTDLNSVLVSLSAPSDKAAKAMESVGLSSDKLSSDIGKKGLTATLAELSNAFLKAAGPDGQLLLATLKGLPSAAQGAANAFLAGTISTKQLNKATADLTPLQQDQIKQFVKVSSSATGLKENYVAAMTAMLGGTRGLGVALQLTGANSVTAAKDAKTIGAAYQSGAKNVAGWQVVQATFNFRLSQFREEAETTAISLGTKLLPAATAAIGFFSAHEGALTATAGGFLAVVGSVTALAIAIKGIQTVSTAHDAITAGSAALRGFSAAAVAAAGVQKGMAASTLAAAAAQRALAVSTLATGEAEGGIAAAGTVFAVALDGETTAVVSLNVAQKALAVTSAALAAVNPVVWAVAGAAAIVGLGVVLVRASDQTGALIAQYQAQDKATGFNISGYQKLAAQLSTVNDGQSKLSTTVRLSSGPVALAKDGSAAYSVALGEVTTAQSAAQTSAQNLVSRLDVVQSVLGVTRTQAEQLAVKAGVTATALASSGTQGQNATGKILGWAQGAGKAAVAADQWKNQTGGLDTALQNLSNGLLANQGNQLGWQSSVQAATAAIKQSSAGLDGNSAAAIAARQALLASSTAAVEFAQSQDKLHGNTQAASSVLEQQIKFLQSTGDHSKFVTDEIDALKTALAGLKSKNLLIDVKGSGEYAVVNAPGTGGKKIVQGAKGMLVTGGTPGKDSVHALLMPGELVVPVSDVQAGKVDHLRGTLPGFAGGGIVPSYVGAPSSSEGSWAQGDYNATITLVEQATAKAAAAAIREAQAKAAAAAAASAAGAAGVAGAGGGNAGANMALARSMAPQWSSGTQWADWVALWNKESGWNQFARNPSGAYGIPQSLPASKMGAAANPPTSNPHAQISWGIGYISGRYGSPEGAWSHELSHNWYAKGSGGAAPGWGVVGERGQELVHFGGGETVLPHSMTSRILSGSLGLPGYASGTPVQAPGKPAPKKPKPLTPAEKLKAARLKELAALVVKVNKLVKTRNKTINTDTLAIDAQELYNLQHPKDKAAVKKLAGMHKTLSKYEARTEGPIGRDEQEINLLRVLTGHPYGAKYAGPPAPAKAAPAAADDTSTGDDTSTDDSSSDSTAAAATTPPPQALPIPTFYSGAGGEGGFIAPGVSASSGIGGSALGPDVGVSGSPVSAVPAMAGAAGSGGDLAAEFAALRQEFRQQLTQLTRVSAAAPVGAATRFADTMNGAARGARQRAAYSAVPGF